MKTVPKNSPAPVRDDPGMVSILEIVDTATGERTTVKEFPGVIIEAPGWLKTRDALIYNSRGKLYEISLADGSISEVDTGYCYYCNNDHVLSPDHTQIAVSHHAKEDYQSRVYRMALGSGKPQLITPLAPSYLHGWSVSGDMAYCAERNGKYDIYRISENGGEEERLTDAPGLNDGPEYAADGSRIWFNSTRTGLMQVWSMNPDGSDQKQMLCEESNDWFPHLSPDMTKVAFVSYRKGDVEPTDHPANKNVRICLMNADGSDVKTLVELFGGQGTMNINSWAPDSRRLAFVSYRYLDK